jgi:hypothetical protein
MKAYYVKYKMYSADEPKGIDFLADNKIDAYEKAVYELIPKKEGNIPYSAWVYSVTYNNGKYREFNTFEGKPY